MRWRRCDGVSSRPATARGLDVLALSIKTSQGTASFSRAGEGPNGDNHSVHSRLKAVIYGLLLGQTSFYGTIVLPVDAVRWQHQRSDLRVNSSPHLRMWSPPQRKRGRYQHTSFDKVGSDPPGLQSWLEPFDPGGPLSRSQRASSGQSWPPTAAYRVSGGSRVTGSRASYKPPALAVR
jgi:hypothetical protein